MSGKQDDERIIKRLPAEIGTYLMNINLDKSLKFLNDAMVILPDDRYCILKRSIARRKALSIREALDDVNAALRLDPHDLRAHAINNDILYLRKYFEKALILNHRLLKQRRRPDDFLMGKMKCMNAVLNSLNEEQCGHPLRDHYKIIRQQAWESATRSNVKKFKSKQWRTKKMSFPSNVELLVPPGTLKIESHLELEKKISSDTENLDGISSHSSSRDIIEDRSSTTKVSKNIDHRRKAPKLMDFPYKPLQERTSNIENFLSEKYLEKLHRDKLFLKQLSTNKGFDAPNKRHEEKMRQLVDKCYKQLCSLQELLRSCRPFYYIKYQEQKNAVRAEEHRKQFLYRQRKEMNQAFHNLYRRLQLAHDTRNLKSLMVSIEQLVALYENLPNTYINEQRKNIIESFQLLRDGYFYFGLFSPGMSEEDKINRVKIRLGMEFQKAPSKDSFYNNQQHYHPTDWSAKIKTTEKRLETARFQEEIIYFYYELSRFHLELGKTEFVYSFARRCMKNAREIKDLKWVMNAQFLIIKASIHNSNKIDALKLLEKTLLISKTTNCMEIIEFLTLALEVVQKTDFSPALNSRGLIRKRQKQILTLFKDDINNKMEAEELFRKLSSIPARRTMSMIPGITITDDIKKEKHSRKRVQSAKRMTNIFKEKRGLGFYYYIKDFVEV